MKILMKSSEIKCHNFDPNWIACSASNWFQQISHSEWWIQLNNVWKSYLPFTECPSFWPPCGQTSWSTATRRRDPSRRSSGCRRARWRGSTWSSGRRPRWPPRSPCWGGCQSGRLCWVRTESAIPVQKPTLWKLVLATKRLCDTSIAIV